MKKLFLFTVMLMLCVGIGIGQTPTLVWAAENVSIQKIIEVVPPRSDTQHPNNSIAMQAVWDPGRLTWRRQVIPFNGATTGMVTEEMKGLAEQLVPDRIGIRDWESWKFTIIYPAEVGREKTVAKSETVTASAKVSATAVPLPKTQQPAAPAPPPPPPATSDPGVLALLNDMKVKLAALEAAEANRPKATKSVVTAKPKPKPIISPLAACQANARNLGLKNSQTEKALGECQTALERANTDLATANDNLKAAESNAAAAKTAHAKELQESKNALAKALAKGYSLFTVILISLIFLICGIAIGGGLEKLRKKKSAPKEPKKTA